MTLDTLCKCACGSSSTGITTSVQINRVSGGDAGLSPHTPVSPAQQQFYELADKKTGVVLYLLSTPKPALGQLILCWQLLNHSLFNLHIIFQWCLDSILSWKTLFFRLKSQYLEKSLHPSFLRKKKSDQTTEQLTSKPATANVFSRCAAARRSCHVSGGLDGAVGVNVSKELENIRRLLEPKLGVRGIPITHLRWAYKLAHGIALSSIGTQVDSGREDEFDNIEPLPRQVIANYLDQMMYVSGETGEPSVETTGIIEDIVRQQVIEIVSFFL
jgi:hypothetical protein